MEQIPFPLPDMPPAPDGQATGREVFQAEMIYGYRKWADPAGPQANEEQMERHGQDSARLLHITASAAGFAPAVNPPANPQQGFQEQLQAGMAQLQEQQQAGLVELRAELREGLREGLQEGFAELRAGQQAVHERVEQVHERVEQLQGILGQVQAGQAQLLARQENVPRRMQNCYAQHVRPGTVVPLVKEQLPPAGAAALGALPPEGTFPATWAAVGELTHTQLDALGSFYGKQFGVRREGLGPRRNAFTDFIKM